MKTLLCSRLFLLGLWLGLACAAFAVLPAEPKIFEVRAFGAVGDGVAMDTKPLQAAIDACHAHGGGIVRVTRGSYHIGTIRLKSHVTLSLENGARLLGSQNLADYDTDLKPVAEGSRICLIYAADATDIAFQGLGVIDGRGTRLAFPGKDGTRPQLMRLQRCERVTFSGLTYQNPANWGLHLIDCRNVHFDGVTISSRENNFNNDGIDLDGCQDVLIENCRINAGDDGICLKSSGPNPCSNIVVRNCELSSATAGFKLGTSSRGGFVDIRITDCWFHDCPMGAVKLQLVDGGRLENVELSRLVMDRVGGPFFIRLGNRGREYKRNTGQIFAAGVKPEGVPVGTLRNVRIKDIVATVSDTTPDRTGIMITGIPGHRVENVSFENVRITFPGGGPADAVGRAVPEDIARYPEQFFFGVLPSWGLYLRHVDGIVFKNVALDSAAPDPRAPVVLDDVLNYDPSGLRINGVNAK